MVAIIWALLDRGFVNSSWIHSNWVSILLPRIASDHSPLFVASQAVPKRKRIPSFPLMRFGVEHPDLIAVVRQSWDPPCLSSPKSWEKEVWAHLLVEC